MRPEELLFKAIVEARQIRYSKYLGTLYGLMAFIAEERKNVKNGIDLFQASIIL